jgi:NifU-like protein involved in Fe-S cluster formation
LDQGCGDILHLLIIQKGNNIEKCFFSAQQSCLITVAFANILCSYLEDKNLKLVRQLLSDCQMMVEKQEYNLNDYPKLEVFNDISNFPNRVECINLVIRGINNSFK